MKSIIRDALKPQIYVIDFLVFTYRFYFFCLIYLIINFTILMYLLY